MNDIPGLNHAAAASVADVAVVIPFYDGADFIERALRSVFAQTIPASEVIVVNDGSQPSHRDALNALALRFPFRVVDKDNGGQGSARNAGVAAASAGFICFLDQDDFYLETHIETLVNALPHGDPRFGFVYGDVVEADVRGQVIRSSMIKEQAPDHPKKSILEMIAWDMYVLPSAALISRKAFEAVNGFDEQFMGYEDDDLFLRIFRAGYTNYFVDKAVTVWCIHTASTSFNMRMSRSRFRYFKKLADLYPDEPMRNRFFMRDYIAPRFGPLFINDVIKRRLRHDPDLPESYQILDGYGALLVGNSSVPALTKFSFRITVWLLKNTPELVFNALSKAVDHRGLALLRRIFH